jgi:hypothetical protein
MNLLWWRKPQATVYHPRGKFDKSALINAVVDVERQKMKPTTIVMTHDQHDDYVRKETNLAWSCGVLGYGESQTKTFMGCKIKIDDVPRWCVGIEDEW